MDQAHYNLAVGRLKCYPSKYTKEFTVAHWIEGSDMSLWKCLQHRSNS